MIIQNTPKEVFYTIVDYMVNNHVIRIILQHLPVKECPQRVMMML